MRELTDMPGYKQQFIAYIETKCSGSHFSSQGAEMSMSDAWKPEGGIVSLLSPSVSFLQHFRPAQSIWVIRNNSMA